MRIDSSVADDDYRVVTEAEINRATAPRMGEAAMPDVPAAIPRMVGATFVLIYLVMFASFAHSVASAMVATIGLGFAIIYVAVPAIFLKVEKRSGRISMSQFLERGLDTCTGHLTGREAVIQFMVLPVCLLLTVTTVGIFWAFVR